ncbi:pyrimidine reductase family protein [Arthrobacter monumenti]
MTDTANPGPLPAPVSATSPAASAPPSAPSSIPIRRLLPWPTVDEATDGQLLEWYAPPAAGDANPWVRFNFISSLDGSATLHGLSGGLASEADKRIFNLLRWPADVILIGAQTVRAEGYAGSLLDENGRRWRQEHGLTEHPVPAVVSGSLHLEPASAFFTEAPVKPIVVTGGNSSPERRRQFERCADLIVCGENRIDIDILLKELAGRGHRQILCEGGPHLFGSFQQAGLVDELCLSLSPTLVAGQDMRIAVSTPEEGVPGTASNAPNPVAGNAAIPMALRHVLAAGDMLFMRYLANREKTDSDVNTDAGSGDPV